MRLQVAQGVGIEYNSNRSPHDHPITARLKGGAMTGCRMRSESEPVILPSSRWQRVAITALLVIPLVLVVVLSAPAWLAWPFLPKGRCDAVLKFLSRLIDWIRAIARSV
jgi:hypothetical protein